MTMFSLSSISKRLFSHKLHSIYLTGFLLLSIGGYLPSAYSYALFSSYGIDRATIELFFVYCFVASLFVGTFVASLADRFGRRLACLSCSFFYGLYHVACHFPSKQSLIIGHIFRGIGDALYATAFEAWLMQEHKQRNLNDQHLEHTLNNANIYLNIATIGTGFLAQLLAKSYGYIAPFTVGVGFFMITFVFILCHWSENYGREKSHMHASFVSAMKILRADTRILLCGLCNALFSASSYIWLIEWAPTLEAATNLTISKPLPLGYIYSGYLSSRLFGACMSGPLLKRFRPQMLLSILYLVAALALSIPIIMPDEQIIVLFGFVVFQICIGTFWPAIALLRSEYIPNELRSTLMNYLRVPQLLLMLIVLLGHFSLSTVFTLCLSMLLVAMLIMLLLRKL
ncbi:unnamed protein product [Adineta ricciae]|uniref:Uncharacterized protein n=1 Tax=Adineta ricciae TaxID=249248 RepID=A0A815ZV15_ADIRI|nr:unnamed protein product [Adineta ricciae]